MSKANASGKLTENERVEDIDHGQLALALYQDLSPEEISISEAPTEVGFNRANIFLDLEGISLSGRRAIDVAYFIVAQGDSNNRYFSREKNREYVTYVVNLEFFKWLMGYRSNNRDHLRNVLRQGQKAAVEVIINDDDLFPGNKDKKIKKITKSLGERGQWVSVPLVGAVGFNHGYVHFQIHEQLEPHIRNPKNYHFLDLRYIFDRLPGRILFDKLQPYINEGITPWFDLEDLKITLNCDSKMYQQYKYFKSKALNKAIEDINRNTDLIVDFDEMLVPGASRKVDKIRFAINHKDDKFNPKNHLAKLTDRYTILLDEFGLNQKQIQTVIKYRKDYDDERIENAIQYTRFQLRKGKIRTSPAGYLMKAIEEGYVLGTAMLNLDNPKSTPPSPTPTDNFGAVDDTVRLKNEKDDDRIKQESAAGLRKLKGYSKKKADDLLKGYKQTLGAKLAASGDQVQLVDIETIEDVLRTPILASDFGLYVFNKK